MTHDGTTHLRLRFTPYCPPSLPGRHALGEEGVSHNLAGLSPRRACSRPEVRQVPRRHARLAHSSARIPRHNPQARQSPDVLVEGRSRQHILELLVCRWSGQPRCLRHYLTQLPSRHVGVGPEVRQRARRYARLSRPSARVARNNPPVRQPPHKLEEGRPHRHVLELLLPRRLREARRVRHDLGKLPPRNQVLWPEARVPRLAPRRIPVDNLPASQTPDILVESVTGWHVGEHQQARCRRRARRARRRAC